MFIDLRKRMKMSRFMNADDGAGTGEANTGNADPVTETPPNEPTQTEKTFTQADVDKLIQDRVAREKKNQLSKEELKAYQDWKESQKTEEEKRNEALESEKNARTQAEERATLMEAKFICASNGVNKDYVDDVITLAKSIVTEEVNLEQAISKTLEKYPNFKGVKAQEEDKKLGFKIGAGDSSKNTSVNDSLASIFGNKK